MTEDMRGRIYQAFGNKDVADPIIRAIEAFEAEPRYVWRALKVFDHLGYEFGQGCELDRIIDVKESGSESTRQFFLMKKKINSAHESLVQDIVNLREKIVQIEDDHKNSVAMRRQIEELTNQALKDKATIETLRSELARGVSA